MNNNQFTSLDLSKYLSEKMTFESDSRTNWCLENYGKKETDYEWILRHTLEEPKNWHIKERVPALTFVDLLHYIKLYGDGKDKMVVEFDNRVENVNLTDVIIHDLVDAYLADNLTIGTHCEKFLKEIIK